MSRATPLKTERLTEASLQRVPANVLRPLHRNKGAGIVHLGVGAFHRAHQAVYTEDAMQAAGGEWGIIGVSLRRPDTAAALLPQNCLYTVETLGEAAAYRVVGAVHDALTAPLQPAAVLAAMASPSVHVVTLTVTEKGYALAPDGTLDLQQVDVAHDLRDMQTPVSTVGWLVRGLKQRFRESRQPLTIISCDNVASNGTKLRNAVQRFASETHRELCAWINDSVCFPNTVVDCIVPATDAASRERVERALGLRDVACVQREEFSQWVIEDQFAGPRPAWDAVGVELTRDVTPYTQLKLHVLNAAHSALAYLGMAQGHLYVRQAIRDLQIRKFLDDMIEHEVAVALPTLPVRDYWQRTVRRFENPMLDHALSQIGEDGSAKLAQRLMPMIIANARAGHRTANMTEVVRSWLRHAREISLRADNERTLKDPMATQLHSWAVRGASLADALDDAALFPVEFRQDRAVRAAMGAVL